MRMGMSFRGREDGLLEPRLLVLWSGLGAGQEDNLRCTLNLGSQTFALETLSVLLHTLCTLRTLRTVHLTSLVWSMMT